MKMRFFLEEEEHKGVLLILSFILGVIIYFSLPFEPSFFQSALFLFLSFLITFFFFFKHRFKFFSLFLFFLFLGIFISTFHALFVDTKFITDTLDRAKVEGVVTFVEERPTSYRLTLENVLIKAEDKETHLNKVRMWVSKKSIKDKELDETDLVCENMDYLNQIANSRGPQKPSKKISTDTCIFFKPDPSMVKKGDYIQGTAFSIRPPSVPIMRGGYYEARTLFFEKIEAVGSLSNLMIIQKGNVSENKIDEIRNEIKEKISFLSPETKGVVQALLLGDSNLITTPVEYLYRVLGLTHILSVSGFHVGLIAFLIYYIVRFLITLITLKMTVSPFVIRAISASCALFVSFFYVVLTGADPPAVRAFIMTGFVFVSFFLNRQVLSVRTIFIAAFLILCYKPVLVLNVGFQLSFMAVLTLCVLVKNLQQKITHFFVGRKILLFVCGLLLLNVLVTVISLPFIGYHFHKLPLYGIVGNLLLSFMFSLFVMPLLLMSVLFMPFNAEGFFLSLVEKILLIVHFIGSQIASFSFVMIPVESFSAWGLVFFSFGMVIFVCMQKKTKFIGLLFVFISFFSLLTYPKSDVILGREGRLLAVRTENKNWRLNESWQHRMVSDSWLLSNGQLPEFYVESSVFKPDEVVLKGVRIAFSPDYCKGADLTFALTKKDYENCPNLISKEDLKQMGTVELFLENQKYKLFDLSLTDRNRPWNQKKLKRNDF